MVPKRHDRLAAGRPPAQMALCESQDYNCTGCRGAENRTQVIMPDVDVLHALPQSLQHGVEQSLLNEVVFFRQPDPSCTLGQFDV